MATVSISVPDELKAKMAQHNDINWSAVARNAIENKVKMEGRKEVMEKLIEMSKKINMSDEDTEDLARKINKGVSDRFREYTEAKK